MPSAGLCFPPSQLAAPQSLLKSGREDKKGEIESTTAAELLSVEIDDLCRFPCVAVSCWQWRWEPRGGKGLGRRLWLGAACGGERDAPLECLSKRFLL